MIPKSVVSGLRIVGAILLIHAFVTAVTQRGEMKPQHHNVDAKAFATESVLGGAPAAAAELPLFHTLEVFIGAFLVIVMQCFLSARSLMKIRRKEVAGCVGRYDHVSFSGMDFAHFKHRGAAVSSQK